MKVLDSDTCIGILRGRTEVLARRAAESDDVVTTWVTASELFYGAAKSVQPEVNAALVVRFLGTLPVLPPDLALLPVGDGPPWMRYAGAVQSGNPDASRRIDEVVYGQKP